MKRVNNIYYKICDIDNIMKFEHIVSVNTSNKKKVEKFQEHYVENIYKIRDILMSKNYIPGEYNIFFIHEPKLRLIMSNNIQDKIINHLVAYYLLVEVFDKTFINTTVATRKGKGTHYGLNLTKKYLNDMKRVYGNNFYYLKFDISKYFYNIDHEVVKSLIRRKIKDKDAINIIDRIIDSTDCDYINKKIEKLKYNEINKIRNSSLSEKEKVIRIDEVNKIPLCKKGKSAPIGSMCSQIIAVMYLDKLNHFIKEKLHIKYYVLYMDDRVLIHEDKDYLKYCRNEIIKFLKDFKLNINMKKTRVDSIKNGLDFLGFKFYIINNKVVLKVRNNTKKKFKKKMKKVNYLYDDNIIDYKEYKMILDSYAGHLSYGTCNKLIRDNSIVKSIESLGEEITIK